MRRKIAFWTTIGDSFEFVFDDFGRFARLAGPWVVIAAILFAILIAVFGVQTFEKAQFGLRHQPFSGPRAISTAVLAIYGIAAYVAFSVAWHRAVLLGEAGSALAALRFQRREWRFLGFWILVALLAFGVLFGILVVLALVGVVISLIVSGGDIAGVHSRAAAFYLIPLALVIVSFIAIVPFLARFSLGLPAIAIEEPEGVFGRSWRRGWRNGWRLIWGPIICVIPPSMAAGLFQGAQLATIFFLGDAGGVPQAIGLVLVVVFYLLGTVAHFVAIAIAVSFLSLSYRQLTQPA